MGPRPSAILMRPTATDRRYAIDKATDKDDPLFNHGVVPFEPIGASTGARIIRPVKGTAELSQAKLQVVASAVAAGAWKGHGSPFWRMRVLVMHPGGMIHRAGRAPMRANYLISKRIRRGHRI
jgi:hypothetical protein